MASDVNCKQNEATCSKEDNPKYLYKHSYTRH